MLLLYEMLILCEGLIMLGGWVSGSAYSSCNSAALALDSLVPGTLEIARVDIASGRGAIGCGSSTAAHVPTTTASICTCTHIMSVLNLM